MTENITGCPSCGCKTAVRREGAVEYPEGCGKETWLRYEQCAACGKVLDAWQPFD